MSTVGLLAALGCMVLVTFANAWLFRTARRNPNSALVKGELAASFSALLVTTMIVVSIAWLVAALHPLTGNIVVSLVATLVAFMALSWLSWSLLGSGKTPGAPRVGGAAPGAPA
jgi:hypothetical protein